MGREGGREGVSCVTHQSWVAGPHHSCDPPPPSHPSLPVPPCLQEVYVVRQGHPLEAHVLPYLVEDRQAAAGSLGYLDFMLQLQKMVMAK